MRNNEENPMKMTTLCYLEKDGKYLMLHRTKKQHDINKDKWIGVGGHAEGTEGPEDCLLREVKEETGLEVTETKYLFSLPNIYLYSGVTIHTLDMFFCCKVKDMTNVKAMDDAVEYQWIALKDIRTELFGLRSIRAGLFKFIETRLKNLKK